MKSKIFIRGHHLSNLANDYLEGENSIRNLIYRNGRINIHRSFKENPELAVEIVEGLDSVCEAAGAEECPDFAPDCVFRDPMNNWDEDRETLREYDLEVGKTYCASDIIERFIDYQNDTGYVSPRCKFLEEKRELKRVKEKRSLDKI